MAEDREPCPWCGLLYEHRVGCIMFGMDEATSSLMYGYPVCQCCHLRRSPERARVHEQRDRYAGGPIGV